MLWNASTLTGYAIEAEDGPIGTVRDLFFEDVGWAIRWLVVDTGNWLPGREVLLPLPALGQPDETKRQFPVKLTRQQVKDSPDVDTAQPVSRQMEADVLGYYGWEPYWGSAFTPLATGAPANIPAEMELTSGEPLPWLHDNAHPSEGDPHLRSVLAVMRSHLDATDGEIGHVQDFLVEANGWTIRYILVDTRNWWPGEQVLISPLSVKSIDWSEKLIHLKVDRQKVKDSPRYDPRITVDGAYDEKFLTYYGVNWGV